MIGLLVAILSAMNAVPVPRPTAAAGQTTERPEAAMLRAAYVSPLTLFAVFSRTLVQGEITVREKEMPVNPTAHGVCGARLPWVDSPCSDAAESRRCARWTAATVVLI